MDCLRVGTFNSKPQVGFHRVHHTESWQLKLAQGVESKDSQGPGLAQGGGRELELTGAGVELHGGHEIGSCC